MRLYFRIVWFRISKKRLIVPIAVSQRTTCRLCDSGALELVVPLAATPVAEKYVTKDQLDSTQETYPLDLYMCLDCGHVQLLDIVDPLFLFDGYTYRTGQTQGIIEHFQQYAANVCERFQPGKDDLVVEVGSNDGTLLRFFQQRELRVVGIDPAREIAQQATASGIPTYSEFMTIELAQRIRQQHGAATVVTANNVFAHTDDLAGMADSIRELMDRDGVFVFEVSYLLDVIDRMLLGTIFHEHMSYHSVKPLVAFLQRHGLELIDVQRVSIQGGSLIGTAQQIGGSRQVADSVRELLQLEADRGLDRPETVRAFANQLRQLKEEVGSKISHLKRQGKSVAGYGAARSGTTLIAQMDLGGVIDYIVDDHPDKVGRFSPGHHIEVLPTQTMIERMPDYVFILAWIHAKKIIEKSRQYLEQGGRFIVCFPEVQIIDADGICSS